MNKFCGLQRHRTWLVSQPICGDPAKFIVHQWKQLPTCVGSILAESRQDRIDVAFVVHGSIL